MSSACATENGTRCSSLSSVCVPMYKDGANYLQIIDYVVLEAAGFDHQQCHAQKQISMTFLPRHVSID